MIKNVSKLLFNKCYFINNEARQDLSIYRPSEPNKKNYYNGDGGGIQLGYFCDTSYMDITFDNCIFENNLANYEFESASNLLIENHFHKKSEGRGGAIYINPSYIYNAQDNPDCKNIDDYLKVSIKRNYRRY